MMIQGGFTMKKALAVTLCTAMTVSLAACGGQSSDPTTVAETTTAAETAAAKVETLTGSAEGFGGQGVKGKRNRKRVAKR